MNLICKYYSFLIILLLLIPARYLSGQINYNMDLMSNWDDDNLPVRSGGSYSDIWGYADADGNEYAIVGGIENIFFFNVTDASNPVLIVKMESGIPSGFDLDPSIWRDFKTYSHYAYACADEGDEGLIVFDLSALPDTVTLVDQYDSYFTEAHSLFIDTTNARLYVAGSQGPSGFQNVIIYDLTDPAVPNEIYRGSLSGGYIHDIHVVDNIAYASHGNWGFYVYDVTDVNNIDLLGFINNYPGAGYNHSSWLSEDGNSVVFCDETHGKKVKIYDVTDLSDMTEQDQFDSNLLGMGNSIAHNPFILGEHVFVSYYHDGVQVFDITDRENVVNVAYYDTFEGNTNYNGYDGAWGVYPFLPSGHIIASDITNGLFVLDLAIGLLDVELLSFEPLVRKNGQVDVNIELQNAESGSTLVLSRSSNGLEYQEIQRVTDIDAQAKQKYHFEDLPKERGLVYYKLIILNEDLTEEYNKVKVVRISDVHEIAVKPNYISSSNPLVMVETDNYDGLTFEIWDLNGRLQYSAEITSDIINLENIITSPGILQIRVLRNDNLLFLRPFLVVE